MLNKILPFIFILTFVCNCPLLSRNRDSTVAKENFINQIKNVDCDDADRLEEVRKLFGEYGARVSNINTEEYDGARNVVLTLDGRTDETVIIGAHYDKTTLGCGVIDNWTGVVIIASLFRSLSDTRPEKTYKFVAFGKEERGLIGSRAMATRIPENRRDDHCAMVNFDSFGLEQTWTLETISDRKLIDLGHEIARKRNGSFAVKNFKGASSDSKSFRDIGIPAITFSGLDDNWRRYLHKKGDQIDRVKFDKVYENYLFALDYLKEIDTKRCDAFR